MDFLEQTIVVLGSTGSIGINTLDVIRQHSNRFSVYALTAYHNVEQLYEQCCEFNPRYAVMVDSTKAALLKKQLQTAGIKTEVLAGETELQEIVTHQQVTTVMAAIVGAAGLLPTLTAVKAGKRVLLANKEPLVMAGKLFTAALSDNGAMLLPVDSEHNAVFQCLPPGFRCGVDRANIEKIFLTASGGPFRQTPINDLKYVTPEQAIKHPNWKMGKKISVDSATMMNKGLEVIEAHWLFGVDIKAIEVLIHPQSTIHSMVTYADGSVLAELGSPDMRTPIAHALSYPERIDTVVKPLDFIALGQLEFAPIEWERYPCLKLAYEAAAAGESAPIYLNAANEVAVSAFLQNRLGFSQIAELNREVLNRQKTVKIVSLDDIICADQEARTTANQLVTCFEERWEKVQ